MGFFSSRSDYLIIFYGHRIDEQQQENNVYFVEKVMKYRHWNKRLKFLIKCLDYSKHQNIWEAVDHLSAALL